MHQARKQKKITCAAQKIISRIQYLIPVCRCELKTKYTQNCVFVKFYLLNVIDSKPHVFCGSSLEMKSNEDIRGMLSAANIEGI